MQRERRHIQWQLALLDRDVKCFAQFSGSRTQRALVMQAAATAHRGNAVGRLQRAGESMTSTTDRRPKLMGWARTWMSDHRMGHWLVAKTVGSHMLEWKTACTSMGID
jgi:hypothetical protein